MENLGLKLEVLSSRAPARIHTTTKGGVLFNYK